ncbi:MAG: rhomboid family intramembrane serine protease [Verrucomicrobia bacterium]|nr:rhomboid family intramembrane serine protease [Verrucomicrobiota bacterium]
MLDDRSYMRAPTYGRRMPAYVILMIVITVAFALQQINAVYIRQPVIQHLALSKSGLSHGYVWQLLTFQFLHGGLWHLFCNLIGIWCFGRFVEERLGSARMVRIYFACGVLGGVLHALMAFSFPSFFGLVPVVGASAGVCGLLAAFAMLEPEGEILLCFVIPVRAKYLLIASMGVALFFTIVPSEPGIAHAAHLGGMLGGIAYLRWGLRVEHAIATWVSGHRFPPMRPRWELVGTPAKKSSRWQRSKEAAEIEDLPPAEFISREVDPILDKISAHGIQSLTERERRILEAARAKMSKR